MNLKVALRMIAGRADFGRFGADDDMTAVAALPHLHFALLEYFGGFDVGKQGAVTFFMVLFNCGDQSEFSRKLRKAFLFGGFGKILIPLDAK